MNNTIALHLVFFSFLFSVSGCGNRQAELTPASKDPNQTTNPQVIYGDDNRLDLYQISDPTLLALAHSTVALMQNSSLSSRADGSIGISSYSYAQANNLCSSERFYEQRSAAFCSGTLIGTDLVLTAGHCVTDQQSCQSTKFVFGFALNQPGAQPNTVQAGEVYGCRQLIHTESFTQGSDFALVKLDRPVVNHPPVIMNETGQIRNGEDLFVIGYPSGLPTKIAAGAKVRDASPDGYFVANLDTYAGNSGSSVFNLQTGLIEGVLVRGENDFVSTNSGCMISHICTSDGCRGEEVTKISRVVEFLGLQPAPAPTPATTPHPAPSPASTGVMYTLTPKLNIPDNVRGGVISTMNIDQIPNGRKVFVKVDISHTWIGDLIIKIVTPDSRTVTLHNRAGGSRHDLRGTYGIDFTPSESLANLMNTNATGPWRLFVSDNAAVDVGVINSWSILFQK